MVKIKEGMYVDTSKYSMFDIIEFLEKEGYKMEWNIPGKINERCLQWWKDKHPEDLNEVLESDYECRGTKRISARVVNSDVTIWMPRVTMANDRFTEIYIGSAMYDMYDTDYDLEYKILTKLSKFDFKNSPEPTWKIKDLEKLINFVEKNNLHIDQEGKKIKDYELLLKLRNLNIFEKKELDYLLKKKSLRVLPDYNEDFSTYIDRKFILSRDENSWTPTYQNWEEDVKKYPELDPRKNGKKKNFLQKIFSKKEK